MRHACVRVRRTCVSIRLPKIRPPDWNRRPSPFRKKGRGKGRVPGLSSSCSLIPRKPRFADEAEDTRVPPLVFHVTDDATVCNRRRYATGLIRDAFEVRENFCAGDLSRLRPRDGIFQSKIRVSGLAPRSNVLCRLPRGEIKSNFGENCLK